MKRTLEKLAFKRKQKEKEFSQKLSQVKENTQKIPFSSKITRLRSLLSRLEETVESTSPYKQKKSSLFSFFSRSSSKDSSQQAFNQQVCGLLKEFTSIFEQNLTQIQELLTSLAELVQLDASLADTRDREWDGLGSNHVGMIFKSLEWRVDRMAHECEDAQILTKKFLLLKEKLNRLLSLLEEGKMPSSSQIKEILQPLEDWRYAGFENRFRGTEEEVKKQQQKYLSYFQTEGKVLDLGCGRGEFMDLLREKRKNADVEGIDLNDHMVDMCKERGFFCQKGDILERLAGYPDKSLKGIFSSQVIEHLPPSYLKRMIELAYSKLCPSSYMVLETINPTSLFALVQVYFLDLSHKQPVHPQTLKFLLQNTGFKEVNIEYSAPLEEEKLQNCPTTDELTKVFNQNMDKLNELLYAPINYAAVGLKK
ncbi:class I SAM-dependent methyltransferase [bacterium]|nr:class I SAM-dependent methyltransferase [bacterium]